MPRVIQIVLTETDLTYLQAIIRRGLDWRERERAETITLLATGKSVQEVAKQQGLCIETIRIRRRKWLKLGLASLPDQLRSGAPSRLTDAHRQQLGQWVETEALSARELMTRLTEKFNVQVSPSTLRTELKRLGYVWKRTRYSLKKSVTPSVSRKPSARSRN